MSMTNKQRLDRIDVLMTELNQLIDKRPGGRKLIAPVCDPARKEQLAIFKQLKVTFAAERSEWFGNG